MSGTPIYFKAHFEWQIFGEFYGDMTIREWVNDRLKVWDGEADSGHDARPNYFLHDYQVTEELEGGPWGLMLARFWVITPLDKSELFDVQEVIQTRLREMMGASDVDLRFTQRLAEAPHRPSV